MTWVYIAIAVAIAFLIFKFLVKPLFKLVAFAALALVIWLLLTNLL